MDNDFFYPDNQDPDATLDYKFRWGTWLKGDTILTSTWTAPGLTIVSEAINGTECQVFLKGGAVGQQYKVVNEITTKLLRTDNRTMMLTFKER